MLWIYYALVKKDASLLLITINSFGCVIETIYLAIFLVYAPSKTRVLLLITPIYSSHSFLFLSRYIYFFQELKKLLIFLLLNVTALDHQASSHVECFWVWRDASFNTIPYDGFQTSFCDRMDLPCFQHKRFCCSTLHHGKNLGDEYLNHQRTQLGVYFKFFSVSFLKDFLLCLKKLFLK